MRSRILFALCFISVVLGQPSFTATSITTSADGARDVYAVDLDSDGDMDGRPKGYG